MGKRKKLNSNEVGLEIGLIAGNYFLNTKHLHYGYWPSDLTVDLFNLAKAQEYYTDLLISHIPANATTILDVGCGVGRLALNLINRGYKVDCLSPSSVLAEHTRSLLADKSHVFECRYEELQTDERYDVILFSESFQYVHVEKGIKKSVELLNDNGHLLICDFFKKNVDGKSSIGGGHRLTRFQNTISKYPLSLVEDIDITTETAPNFDIVDDILTTVGLPIWNILMHFCRMNYRLIFKVAHRIYRKKIEKINHKYFSGSRNADNFKHFKTYRLFLYKRVMV